MERGAGMRGTRTRTSPQRAEAALQYRLAGTASSTSAYRYQRDLLEQFDASAAWPIGKNWHAFARWVYALARTRRWSSSSGVEY